ncbi:MAG: DUF2461 domain-containing protein [Woeseiaceae bacterium]|nr:DUF2461 domain-containing protein [Woeseiaceae bacterium]
MASRYASFTPSTLKFLEQLAENNEREWFKENKSRYEQDVLDVALRFIASMQNPLENIAPHFTAIAERQGGSLMRIYRDTRFSKNKQPYKTNIGIQFRHENAKDVHAPGYYLHIEPGSSFIGMGMWMPESSALKAIRTRIVEKPTVWSDVLDSVKRPLSLGGTSLTRPPKGFSADDPYIDDLKRKSFILVRELPPEQCLAPQFQRTVENTFRNGESLMRFLCDALRIPF